MVERMIEYIKKRKILLKAEAEILFEKVNIYAERDEFAAAIHFRKLQEVNAEYLDLDMKLQEAEKEIPPDVEPLFI